jgi:hypothetical protein
MISEKIVGTSHLLYLHSCLISVVFLAKFRSVLHKAIQDGLTEEVDDILINGALQLQEGWMHIHGNSSNV